MKLIIGIREASERACDQAANSLLLHGIPLTRLIQTALKRVSDFGTLKLVVMLGCVLIKPKMSKKEEGWRWSGSLGGKDTQMEGTGGRVAELRSVALTPQ